MMKKLKVLIMLVLFVSVFQGCSQKDSAEEDLKAAIKNNDALTSFHVELEGQGDYVSDISFKEGDRPYWQDYKGSLTIYKNEDYLYTHENGISTNDLPNGSSNYEVHTIERKNADETFEISYEIQDPDSNEGTVIWGWDLTAHSYNNDYLGFITNILEEFQEYYDFTETESNGMKIIEAKLKDIERFNQSEFERLHKLGINPLESSEGYRFQKRERLIDDWKFIINEDGYIININYHEKTDYGEEIISDNETIWEFSQFNEPTMNTEYLDSLIQQGKEGSLEYGDTISLEF